MNKETINKLVDWMKTNQNYSTDEMKKAAIEGGAHEEEIIEALKIINAKAGTLEYKGVGIRLFSLIIDLIVLSIFFKILTSILISTGLMKDPFSLMINQFGSTGNNNDLIKLNLYYYGVSLIKILIGILYYVLMEWKLGATIGKLVTGIRIKTLSGEKISFTASLIRNIMRIIDFMPFFYLVGVISIWNSKTKQRLGDRLANTVVVSK